MLGSTPQLLPRVPEGLPGTWNASLLLTSGLTAARRAEKSASSRRLPLMQVYDQATHSGKHNRPNG